MDRGKKEEIIIFLFFFPSKAGFSIVSRNDPRGGNKKLADSWPTCEQGREGEDS